MITMPDRRRHTPPPDDTRCSRRPPRPPRRSRASSHATRPQSRALAERVAPQSAARSSRPARAAAPTTRPLTPSTCSRRSSASSPRRRRRRCIRSTPRRTESARRAVPGDFAIRQEPGPAAQRRSRARRRRARGRAGQRRGFAAGGSWPIRCCRCTPAPSAASRRPRAISPRCRRSCSSPRSGRTDAALQDAVRAAAGCTAMTPGAADWSALGDGLADAHNLFVRRPRPRDSPRRRKPRSSSRKPAACTPRPTAPPKCSTVRWRWSGRDSRCSSFAQPDETAIGTLALAQEFRARGARVWVASEHGDPGSVRESPAGGRRAASACAPLLAIQSFYRAINALALRRGHNPDVPPHLNKVTETV